MAAKQLVNFCLKVGGNELTLRVWEHGSSGYEPPYHFRVWYSPEGQGTSSSGDSVDLDKDSDVRVVVWSENPGTVSGSIFNTPTTQDEAVESDLTGGSFTICSGGGVDPWPPT